MKDSHSESEILNRKKRRREEKPEALASLEQEQEHGSKKKKRRKKKKNKEKGAEPNDPPQPQVCPIKPLAVVPTSIPINPEPDQATLSDPKDTPQKRKREKKKKNVVKPQGAQPKEPTNAKHPQPSAEEPKPNEANAQAQHPPVCLKPSLEMPIPVDPATPIDTEQKTNKKKRRQKKRKSGLKSEGDKPNEHNGHPPETPVQRSIDPTVPMDQTIPIDPAPPIGQTIPVEPATPIDTDQKTNKKKRRKKKRKSGKGDKPNEHNGNPAETETPVQRSIDPTIAAPSIDPTVPIDQSIPTDPATPLDPEQKTTKKNRRKKRMSALKSEGSESHRHNADPTAEAPVQGTEGVTVIKASIICRACRQPGHKFTQCRRLKHLSKDEEICFFCGEIGHSLGKCSVSLAGGGRFAKCLFCHAHGHFSYNCPGNGHGIDPKVVAANGPINKTAVEA